MTNARTLGNIGRNATLEGGGGGLTLISSDTITTAVGAVDITLPAAYTRFRLIVQDLTYVSTGSYCFATISLDGGTTFESTLYATRVDVWPTGIVALYPTDGMIVCNNNLGTNPVHSIIDIVNTASQFALNGNSMLIIPGSFAMRQKSMGWRQTASKANVLRLKDFSNNMTAGTFSLYGYKETV